MLNAKLDTAPPPITRRESFDTPEPEVAVEDGISLAPVQPIVTGPRDGDSLTALMKEVAQIATRGLANPSSVYEDSGAIIDVIEKLMVMLANEERKAKHDRYSAKMTKLVERIEKLLSAAKKTLEAGKKELDAISKRSGWQMAFAILAVIVIAAAIVAAPAVGPAALMIGAALAAVLPTLGSAAGELHAKGDVEDKQELNQESADLNAVATELEKLMENDGELSSEAKELLRKLLEILMKVFEKLNATRRKQAEGMGQ